MCRTTLLLLVQFLLTGLFTTAQAQSIQSSNLRDELTLSRELLERYETEVDRNAIGLLEPIEQLADRLMALNQFNEAHRLLDRAMQITRLHNGLYTSSQIPLIRKKIENFSNRRDWESAREQMNYLFWFYENQEIAVNQGLIGDLLALSEQHLRGSVEDIEEWSGYHLLRVNQLNLAIISTAAKVYGENDPRSVPLLYRQILHLHVLNQVIESRNSASMDLRRIVPTSGRLRERSEVQDSYYFVGLSLLNQIRNIYLVAEPVNPEGLAMAGLYIADWQLLFDLPELAAESYRKVYGEFLGAELRADIVNSYFSDPRVLPIQYFYPSISQADSEVQVLLADTEGFANEVGSSPLFFNEWSSAFSSVRSPEAGLRQNEKGYDFVLFSFDLVAANELSPWFIGRHTKTISSASEAEIVGYSSANQAGGEEIFEKLNQLRFRPRLNAGLPQKSRGLLKYQFASEL